MISEFHIQSLQKRFPKAFNQFKKESKAITWNLLEKWLKSKDKDYRGYYSIGLQKIENKSI